MKEPTPEERAVIKYRQAQCSHSIIRNLCDREARCVHCGISQADAESQTASQFGAHGWARGMGGIP